jgi:hypothetical protein
LKIRLTDHGWIAIVFVVVALGLVAFPPVARPKVESRARGGGHGSGRFSSQVEDQGRGTKAGPGHRYQENPGRDQGWQAS